MAALNPYYFLLIYPPKPAGFLMSKEIQVYYPTIGLSTLYAVVMNSTGQVWNTVTPAFETPLAADWANYAIPLTCIGVTVFYEADFPVGIATLGAYSLLAFIKGGGSPTMSDVQIANQSRYEWTGIATVIPVSPNSSGQVTVATNNDKTGYSLTVTPPTAAQIATAVLTDTGDNTVTGSPGKILSQLAGAFTGTSSVYTTASLVNAPTGGTAPTVSQIVTGIFTDLLSSSDFSTAGSIGAQFKANVVSSISSGVTVTTNNDKSGYNLGSAGLDSIAIEAGVNARQALSPILAAAAGVTSGMGTTNIIVKAGNSPETTRITSTCNITTGERTSVTLSLP